MPINKFRAIEKIKKKSVNNNFEEIIFLIFFSFWLNVLWSRMKLNLQGVRDKFDNLQIV